MAKKSEFFLYISPGNDKIGLSKVPSHPFPWNNVPGNNNGLDNLLITKVRRHRIPHKT